MCSVSVDTNCHKRGQTSRPAIGTAIHTHCNSEAHLHDHCYLACVHRSSGDVPCESSYKLLVYGYKLCTLSDNLDLLVHNDFRLSPSSSKTSKQVRIQAQESNQTNQLNIARYRKVLSAALWLQFALVACYLLEGLVMALVSNSEPSAAVCLAWDYITTLVFINSSLNPILYC